MKRPMKHPCLECVGDETDCQKCLAYWHENGLDVESLRLSDAGAQAAQKKMEGLRGN